MHFKTFSVSFVLLLSIILFINSNAINNNRNFAVINRQRLKSTWSRTQCGSPSGNADIPTRWANDVSPYKTPLTSYPRPMMVRKLPSTNTAEKSIGRKNMERNILKRLRDVGTEDQWYNLNGLWEWEATTGGIDNPPFGKTLNSIPFNGKIK